MRIAFIGQKGIPATQGGVERHVEQLALRLSERGHKCLVYSRYQTDLDNPNIKIIKFSLPQLKALATIWQSLLASIDVLFRKVDLIHFHSTGPAFFMFLPKIFRPDVKLIFTYHSPDWAHSHWGQLAKWSMIAGEKMGLVLADEILTVSPKLKIYIEDKYGYEAHVVPNGVTVKTEATPTQNPLKTAPKYILVVSRLIKLKGVDKIIQAFNLINRDYPEYELLIAGSGTENDNQEKYLTTLAQNNPKIKFLGCQPYEKLEPLYQNAAFYVQASEKEGLPITVLEAASQGTPCLLSDIPEHFQIFQNHGRYFKTHSFVDLAAQMRHMLDNLPTHKQKAEQLSHQVKRQYNWENIVDQIEIHYKKQAKLPALAHHNIY